MKEQFGSSVLENTLKVEGLSKHWNIKSSFNQSEKDTNTVAWRYSLYYNIECASYKPIDCLMHRIDELKRKPFFITGQSLDLMVLSKHWTLRVHRVNYELLNK